MDKIKIPTTTYIDLNIPEFSQFVNSEIKDDVWDKDAIADNMDWFLKDFGIPIGDIDDELYDEITDAVLKELNLC